MFKPFITTMFSAVCIIIIIIIMLFQPVSASGESSSSPDDGMRIRETVAFESGKKLRLFQLDPVKKNHMQELKLQGGKTLQIKTLAEEPPLFEIPGFLSDKECNHIKQLALSQGLFTSTLKEDKKDDEIEDDEIEDALSTQDIFNESDANGDEVLDANEILAILDDVLEINTFLRPEDVSEMLRDVPLDLNDDGALNFQEFSDINSDKITQIKTWISVHSTNDDSKLNRVSQQAWLTQDSDDKVLTDLRERAIELTGLPADILKYSESLQVVYYDPGGHFHAHYDSEDLDQDQPCSHTVSMVPSQGKYQDKGTRLCRFITILYYLDDTPEGGETAFPVADNETFSEEELSMDTYDLSHHCHDANLYVTPEKGKAVMWYNHYINETTGWLGQMNHYSLHGGCDVKRGTKWIANNWITVDDSYDKQIRYMEGMKTYRSLSNDLTDDESYEENNAFLEAVQNMTEIWAGYVVTSTGAEFVKKFFAEEQQHEHVMSILIDYTINNAAEIQVADVPGTEGFEYTVIWHDSLGWTSDEGTAILSDFILMANAYRRNTDNENEFSVAGAKPLRVFKNLRLGEKNSLGVLEKSENLDERSAKERDEL